MKKLFFVALVTFGCGGIDDAADEDYRIITIVHADYPDGSERDVRIVGEIDLDFDRDVDIEGPWLPEGEDLGNGNGRSRQAFSYGANSRYGHLEGAAASAADNRCPLTWASPQTCMVPAWKNFAFKSFILTEIFGNFDDGVVDANLSDESEDAFGYMHGLGGFTLTFADPEFGTTPNSWIEDENGVCASGALACTSMQFGAVFTSGGKRFRKSKLHSGFGWPDMQVRAAINMEPAAMNTFVQRRTNDPASRANLVQNVFEHELAHVYGLGHNPAGGATRATDQPAELNDPGTVLLASEISAAAAYQP